MSVPQTPGAQPYSVTHTVGDSYQQPTENAQNVYGTASGYKVYSSVAGSNVQ